MPLIECPDCHKQVSDQATSCPGCAHPFRPVDTTQSDVIGHGVPALFSFFVPGLGQLIKGDYLGALFPWILVFLAVKYLNDFGILALALFVIWVVQLVDTYRIKKKSRLQQTIDAVLHKERRISTSARNTIFIGVGLVTILIFLVYFGNLFIEKSRTQPSMPKDKIEPPAGGQESTQRRVPFPNQVNAESNVVGRTKLLVGDHSDEIKLTLDSRNLASELCEPAKMEEFVARLLPREKTVLEKKCYPFAWKDWVHDTVKELLADNFKDFQKDIGTESPGEFVLILPKNSVSVVFDSCKPHFCINNHATFLVDPKTREVNIIWKSESGFKYLGPQERLLRENNLGAWLAEAELK